MKIGGRLVDPSALGAFHAKLFAKHQQLVNIGDMSERAFYALPEMATLEAAMKFVGMK